MSVRSGADDGRVVQINGKEIRIRMEPDPDFVPPPNRRTVHGSHTSRGRGTDAIRKHLENDLCQKAAREKVKQILYLVVHSDTEPDLDAAADLILSVTGPRADGEGASDGEAGDPPQGSGGS